MDFIREQGQHKIYAFDKSRHGFLEFFQDLFSTSEIDKLSLDDEEFKKEEIHDLETSYHKKFYAEIKTNSRFKHLYCNLIKTIHENFFPDEEVLIYQSFPSVRFQFINNITVPPHCDSDDLGRHPIGEKNFILPITKMFGTNRLFIESEPEKGDFAGVDLEYGNLFWFNGNKCIHYNQVNTENAIRVSLDFRVILAKDYNTYINTGAITQTNPRDPEKIRIPTKMVIGGYYMLTHRGQPLESMMNWHFQKSLLLQSQPNFDINEANACFDYLKDGTNFITEFRKTTELESIITAYTGAKYAVMTTSGNMALILALMALEIGPGHEVIVPNYTMIATINSVKFVGATPVIVDVEKDSLTLGLEKIKSARTEKTKAILHVSLNNRHANIKSIAEWCETEGVLMIEDAAQSLGCFVDGKHFGRYGKIGCFSLSTPKIISTGQGGFLITDDEAIAKKINMIKNFGRKCGGVDVFETFGINAKFTDLQAVIGLEQMKKLDWRVKRMREIFEIYYINLSSMMIPAPFDSWIPWFVEIFVEPREALMKYLQAHNIQTRVTYPEINKTSMYSDEICHFNSNFVSNQGLFLPSHTLLTNKEIEHICSLIKLFFSMA